MSTKIGTAIALDVIQKGEAPAFTQVSFSSTLFAPSPEKLNETRKQLQRL
jgi:hypothetical protein